MTNWFDTLRTFVTRATGVALDADYRQIAEARLAPVMRRFELHSLEALVFRASAAADEELTQAVVEAMMTGETFFFRDRKPFDVLREQILPALIESGEEDRSLRIWSAACSSGQEAYSVAMLLDEMARELRGWSTEIVATDVSHSAIAKARNGCYNQFEVQRGLPVAMLLRYFSRDGDAWAIAEHLRSSVSFHHQNLLHDFRDLGTFDVIFCRNVNMYLNADARQSVISRILSALRPGGWLFIGATESLPANVKGITAEPACAGLYRKHRPANAAQGWPRLVVRNS